MPSRNKVELIANVGRDPELRYLPDGTPTVTLGLATTETWNDKNTGEKKEATEWHRVVFYRKLAEIAAQYLVKGSLVFVEGKLKTRKWQDKDGRDQYTTEVIADELIMLGGKRKDGAGDAAGASGANGADGGPSEEEIPF